MGLHNQITGNYISENVSQSLHDLKYMGFVDCLDSVPGIFPSDHLTFLFLGSIMSDDVKACQPSTATQKERKRKDGEEGEREGESRKERRKGREGGISTIPKPVTQTIDRLKKKKKKLQKSESTSTITIHSIE